jgi:hypothetical protein
MISLKFERVGSGSHTTRAPKPGIEAHQEYLDVEIVVGFTIVYNFRSWIIPKIAAKPKPCESIYVMRHEKNNYNCVSKESCGQSAHDLREVEF